MRTREACCAYNVGVECGDQTKCGECGWNPEVERARLRRMKQAAVFEALQLCDKCRDAEEAGRDVTQLGPWRGEIICDDCHQRCRGSLYVLRERVPG